MAGMHASTGRRMLEDLTGRGAVVRTADDARTLQTTLRNAIRANKPQYTMQPGWDKGVQLTRNDRIWILSALSAHGVSVPGTRDKGGRACAIKYDFMPYTIVETGAAAMARTILRLEIPAPRDPFLPPPGLTTEEVVDRIIDMIKNF